MKTIELSEFLASPDAVIAQAAQGALFSVVTKGQEQFRVLPPRGQIPRAGNDPFLAPNASIWTPGKAKGSVTIVGDIVSPTPPEEYGSLI